MAYATTQTDECSSTLLHCFEEGRASFNNDDDSEYKAEASDLDTDECMDIAMETLRVVGARNSRSRKRWRND